MIYNIDSFPYNEFYKYCKSKKKYKLRKREYKIVDLVSSYDIETTSTIYNDNKIGFMYLWGFSFDNEFEKLISLSKALAYNVDDVNERNKMYASLESYIMRRMIVHASTKNYNNLFTTPSL